MRHAPLRQKLTALTMVCSAVALLTTAIVLGAYEGFIYRKTMYEHLQTLSLITARNGAAARRRDFQESEKRSFARILTPPPTP